MRKRDGRGDSRAGKHEQTARGHEVLGCCSMQEHAVGSRLSTGFGFFLSAWPVGVGLLGSRMPAARLLAGRHREELKERKRANGKGPGPDRERSEPRYRLKRAVPSWRPSSSPFDARLRVVRSRGVYRLMREREISSTPPPPPSLLRHMRRGPVSCTALVWKTCRTTRIDLFSC